MPPLKLVILISGKGSNLSAIIQAIKAQKLKASITLVISNKAAAGIEFAKAANIAHKIIPAIKGESREAYDQRLIDSITPHAPDLIVLAGFMRILSPNFIQQFVGKIINIHPSLLPKYKGLHTHQRVIDAGEQYHGASVHYVEDALDSGEIILQSRIKVDSGEQASELRARVLKEEHIIYPRAIAWLASQRICRYQ